LTDAYIQTRNAAGNINVITRDLSDGLPFVSEEWVGANFTPAEDRTDAQRGVLATSDALIEELQAADEVVIGLPIYNFGMPAVLKAWIDQIARARVTFRYTENGPVGLLEGKPATIILASGGTEAGSAIDFALPHLKHILGFIGIHDVTVFSADQAMKGGEEKIAAVAQSILAHAN
jgi:FMN-dependent NADH-azoreductase